MPHGAINLTQVFHGDVTITTNNSSGPVTTVYSGISAKNQHYRPNNTVNPRDASGWRSPSSFYHNRETELFGEVALWRGEWPELGSWTSNGPGEFSYSTNWGEEFLFPSKLEDRCINKALTKLLDDGPGLGEDFAQWRQFVEMVTRHKVDIAKSARAYKSANPKAWKQLGKLRNVRAADGRFVGIPKSWLEFQYGVKPALEDIESASRIIAQRMTYNSGRLHVVSRLEQETRESFPPSMQDYLAQNGQPILGEILRWRRDRALVRFDFYIGNPILHAAAQMGLANPAQTAYNLLPGSFLLDWFLPVDSFLGALAAPYGLNFKSGTVTRVLEVSQTFVPKEVPYLSGGGILYAGAMSKNVYNLERDVFTDFPGPRMPHFKNPISLGHFANATSLLATVFHS